MFNKILVYPLFNLLVLIYALIPGHDFGIAIIILTILIRILLWPLVNKQLYSQRALQQLAPEVAKIKIKAKGDRQLESKMLMELYKERKINPFSSLGVALIQLPLLIALFIVLRDIVKPGEIAAITYGPIRQLPIIKDIINSNLTFNTQFLGILDLAKPSVIIGVLAGIAQYFQTKQLTPNTKSNDPQAKTMAATIYIFPALTVLIALSLPAALALYWAATSALAIFQQYLVLKKDVEVMEKEA